MALALHQLDILCTVYEMRDSVLAPRTAGGAMMISPNALSILDGLGVYPRLIGKGYPFEWTHYKNADEETVDRYPLGHEEAYGYKAMRIYRQELLNILYDVCSERGVPIVFNKKFARIIEETEKRVSFEFADGTADSAALLVGAEGIHSKVRSYINPGVEPKYTGLTALTWETPTAQLRIPEDKDYAFPVAVLTAAGAFVLAPQRPDGSAMLAGTQFRLEDRSREEWERLLNDKQQLRERARENMDVWPDIARSAIENIDLDPHTLNIWPFRALPRLDRWASPVHRRIVILGDAAHAVPPTTGQGASQAFEDVLTLGLLVARLREERSPGLRWEDALDFWQKLRQERMDDLLELTRRLNNKRLPMEKQVLLGKDDLWSDESATNTKQMAWLYLPQIEEKVDAWVREKLGGRSTCPLKRLCPRGRN